MTKEQIAEEIYKEFLNSGEYYSVKDVMKEMERLVMILYDRDAKERYKYEMIKSLAEMLNTSVDSLLEAIKISTSSSRESN